ncbi:hypothetical protein ASD30_00325 [Nocardioides sp. Root140]|nr:hypothetical protein ASD30_00325 [Nocardioides sp. Root140]
MSLIQSVIDAAESAYSQDWIESLEDQITDLFDRGEQWRLVKGRWLTKFIAYQVATHVNETVERQISPSTLTKTALAYLDPTSDCFLHYFKRLDRIVKPEIESPIPTAAA